jgi:hypothetical protein
VDPEANSRISSYIPDATHSQQPKPLNASERVVV